MHCLSACRSTDSPKIPGTLSFHVVFDFNVTFMAAKLKFHLAVVSSADNLSRC